MGKSQKICKIELHTYINNSKCLIIVSGDFFSKEKGFLACNRVIQFGNTNEKTAIPVKAVKQLKYNKERALP